MTELTLLDVTELVHLCEVAREKEPNTKVILVINNAHLLQLTCIEFESYVSWIIYLLKSSRYVSSRLFPFEDRRDVQVAKAALAQLRRGEDIFH